MKLKPYYLGLVLVILLGLTASSAFGVGGAGSVTGGTFPACVDPSIANASTVKIAGKQVNPGGLVRVPPPNANCLASETTLNLNSYAKTILVSPGVNNVASGTNLQNAMTAATAGTLIKLEPGSYDLATTPLTMKPNVDLEGSGEGLTTITSQIVDAFAPTAGTVVITSSSEIRFLTVANTGSSEGVAVYAKNVSKTAKLTNVTTTASGSGLYSYSIYNNASSPTILNSTITVSGIGTNYWGMYNLNSSPTILNSTITASGGTTNVSIYNNNSYPIIQTSTIIANGGTTNNGIYNSFASPTILNSTVTASGGSNNYSVNNNSFSTTIIKNSTITASGGTTNYGIYNSSSNPIIQFSTIAGSNSIFNVSGTIKVGESQLVGPVNSGTGFTCINVFNDIFTALTASCG